MEEFAINSTPNTGCTRTIISGKIAKANNIQISRDDTVLIAANGEKMSVLGITNLTARTNDREATISALVSAGKISSGWELFQKTFQTQK